MKKIEKENDVIRRLRLKKHLVKVKQSRMSSRKKKHSDLSFTDDDLVKEMPLLGSFWGKNQPDRIKNSLNRDKIKTPKNFNIFEKPCDVLGWLTDFVDFSLNSRSQKIQVNHSKTIKYCLGSEVLLGLFAGEVKKLRKMAGRPLEFNGVVNKKVDHQLLLAEVGIISELDNAVLATSVQPNDKIHVYKKDCTINDTVSSTGDDIKNVTANEFVEHIERALNDHHLKLSDDAGSGIKACLGEILDNVSEHSGQTSPVWSVRGYINNSSKNCDLELVVLNMGRSIAETFDRLPDGDHSKTIVSNYAKHHLQKQRSSFNKEQLYTIAALQGKVSSKNKDDTFTRGQGTVTLIETFEEIYKDYQKLREPKNSTCATMNLISGHVVVKFDGTYMTRKKEDEEGGEKVTIAFNETGKLTDSPDPNYVCKMKSFFPGLMINIKIPLRGSVTPIGE
jgi:hypothetical protein